MCRAPAKQREAAQCMKDTVELLTDLFVHACVHGSDDVSQGPCCCSHRSSAALLISQVDDSF